DRPPASAALAERRAEGVALFAPRRVAPAKHRARRMDRLQLEMAAADRCGCLAGSDEHARTVAARHRAARVDHLADGGGAAGGKPRRSGIAKHRLDHAVPPAACTAVIARRIASLVAGAASGGSTRCPPTAETASRIAKNTEKGRSSGGSPVALLRWIVSATLSLPRPSFQRRTSKTGGQSLAVGIL